MPTMATLLQSFVNEHAWYENSCQFSYKDGKCPRHPVKFVKNVKGFIKVATSRIPGAGLGKSKDSFINLD